MRLLATITAVSLIAGCTTAGSLVGRAEKLERSSVLPAQAAAYCVARNAERVSLPVLNQATTKINPGPHPGSFEVVHSSLGDVVSVTIIEPERAGSKLVVWFKYSSSVAIGANFGARVLGDC